VPAVFLRLRLNELKSIESDFWEEASDVKNSVPKGGKSLLWFPTLNAQRKEERKLPHTVK